MSHRLLRVVLDTNVVVSAVLTVVGLESHILRLALDAEIRLFVSPPILREYFEVLARAKFRLSEGAQQQIAEGIERAAVLIAPKPHLQVCPDPRQHVPGMLRDGPCRLPDHWQPATFSGCLEINSHSFEPPILGFDVEAASIYS